jgi:hypothetical protein
VAGAGKFSKINYEFIERSHSLVAVVEEPLDPPGTVDLATESHAGANPDIG